MVMHATPFEEDEDFEIPTDALRHIPRSEWSPLAVWIAGQEKKGRPQHEVTFGNFPARARDRVAGRNT